MRFTVPFVLASRSPRRKKLLSQIGVSFSVHAADVDESVKGDSPPETLVQVIADRKAATVSEFYPESLTLGADTIVFMDNTILGKPSDAGEAKSMLRMLSGSSHFVFTGLSLRHPATNRVATDFEKTRVTFGAISEREIEQYVVSGAPMDKAGAYGIQDDRGALFVSNIDGDYYNVVGLPLHRFYKMVKLHFSDLLDPKHYL